MTDDLVKRLREQIALAIAGDAKDAKHFLDDADAALSVVAPVLEGLRADVTRLTNLMAGRDEINQGWVQYKYRVQAEQERWREQLAEAIGYVDPRGVAPQMPELIEMVAALRSPASDQS